MGLLCLPHLPFLFGLHPMGEAVRASVLYGLSALVFKAAPEMVEYRKGNGGFGIPSIHSD